MIKNSDEIINGTEGLFNQERIGASMGRCFTLDEIRKADKFYLYTGSGDTLYVIVNDNAYFYSRVDKAWYIKENFWDYFDSRLITYYYLYEIDADKAVKMVEQMYSENKV